MCQSAKPSTHEAPSIAHIHGYDDTYMHVWMHPKSSTRASSWLTVHSSFKFWRISLLTAVRLQLKLLLFVIFNNYYTVIKVNETVGISTKEQVVIVFFLVCSDN